MSKKPFTLDREVPCQSQEEMEVPEEAENQNILEEASLFLERNKDEIAGKVVKYYKRYIPAYSSFSGHDFLEEVREEVLERISLMSKHLVGEKDIGHLASEFFKKLVEKRLVQGIPFSELLGAYVLGKNIILNALKREFLQRQLEKEEVFQLFQAVAEATESVLIPMALTYEDTQEHLDILTHCYNHSYFQEILSMEIEKSRQEGTHLSLMLIDIDHFRQFNEKHGYKQSDGLLRELSLLMLEKVNADEIVARYNADQFAIILPRRHKSQTIKIAKKLRKLVEEHNFYLRDSGITRITVSIGVVSYPDEGRNRVELIEKALIALNKAKVNGGNTVVTGRQ